VMIIVLQWRGSALVTPQSSKGIIDLEFAKTSERFHELQLFWNHEMVLQNIYLDFLFIAAYTWFLITACKAVNNGGSQIFSALALSAAAFGVLENFLMVLVWNERFDPSVLQIVFFIAVIKFFLIAIVLGFFILSLFGLFKKKSFL
jgi:hypothetical protein